MLKVPDEVETLVRRLAMLTGKTAEDVVREAVEATAREAGVTATDVTPDEREDMIEAALAIVARSSRRAVLDTRPEDEVLGYDDRGIPG